MITKIVTNKNTEQKIVELQKHLRLNTKAAVLKIGLGIALNKKPNCDNLPKVDMTQYGAAYHNETVFGDEQKVYDNILIHFLQKNASDEEMSEVFNALVQYGIEYLYSKYQYYLNYDKLILFLLKGEFSDDLFR